MNVTLIYLTTSKLFMILTKIRTSSKLQRTKNEHVNGLSTLFLFFIFLFFGSTCYGAGSLSQTRPNKKKTIINLYYLCTRNDIPKDRRIMDLAVQVITFCMVTTILSEFYFLSTIYLLGYFCLLFVFFFSFQRKRKIPKLSCQPYIWVGIGWIRFMGGYFFSNVLDDFVRVTFRFSLLFFFSFIYFLEWGGNFFPFLFIFEIICLGVTRPWRNLFRQVYGWIDNELLSCKARISSITFCSRW